MIEDECPCSKSGFHRWHYAESSGITVRICEHCRAKEACFTDQAFQLWGHVPEGYTILEFDD